MESFKTRGLIRGPLDPAPIEKYGVPAAVLGKIRTVWMYIDPALAQKWMENNFRNRRMDEGTYVAYARDLVTDLWFTTHQGIAFNDRDELIDGQHRLMALILSGKTVMMMVTFGLPSIIKGKEMTTMDAVDRGRTRSVADQLTIQHGFKDASITAAICSSLGGICFGERTKRLSVGQTLEIFRQFEHAVTWVIIHRSKKVGLRSAGVLAGFAFALITEDGFFGAATPIALMYEKLMEGENMREGSPMQRLRKILTSDEAQLLTRSFDRGLAELVLQAIYLEGKGKPVSKLELSLDGANHFRSLQKQRVEKIAGIFRLPKTEGKK